MLNSFTIGSYYETESLIHKINPLIKIICSLLSIVAIVNTNSFIFTFVIMIIVALIVYLSKIPVKAFTKSFVKSKYFLISILVINIIFSGSMITGLFIITKMLIIIVISEILLFTTKIKDMIIGLQIFLSPLKRLKISSNKIAFSLAFSIHFIPILFNQANQIMKAQSSRGFTFDNLNLKNKIKMSKALILPLFNLTLRKADLLADSLQLRNFDYNKNFVNHNFYKIKIYDTIILMFFGIILLISFM